jgi:hypothetical protein
MLEPERVHVAQERRDDRELLRAATPEDCKRVPLHLAVERGDRAGATAVSASPGRG